MLTRIVCVGNRFVACDGLGPRVHDELVLRPQTGSVEVVDGGLLGLDLLPIVEGSDRVVFVDAALEGPSPRVLAPPLDPALVPVREGHAGGLGFLLRMLPVACDGEPPPWRLVCAADSDEAMVRTVADLAWSLATDASWGERVPPRVSPKWPADRRASEGGSP